MRYSILISLWLLLFFSCASTHNVPTQAVSRTSIFDTEDASQYRVRIKMAQAELTGILVLKYMDTEWRGSLVNEFGIKAFDFTASQKKCELQNVIPYLNKWYIRRTIESDFAYLLWSEQQKNVKGKSLDQLPDGAFLLKNEKRGIEYLFQRINK